MSQFFEFASKFVTYHKSESSSSTRPTATSGTSAVERQHKVQSDPKEEEEDVLQQEKLAQVQNIISEIEENISRISKFLATNKKINRVERIDELINQIEDGLAKRPYKKQPVKEVKNVDNAQMNIFNIDESHIHSIVVDNKEKSSFMEKQEEDEYNNEIPTLPKLPIEPNLPRDDRSTTAFVEASPTAPKRLIDDETKPMKVSETKRAFTHEESPTTEPKMLIEAPGSVSSDQSSSFGTEYSAEEFDFSSLDKEILHSVKELEVEAQTLDVQKKEMLLNCCEQVRDKIEICPNIEATKQAESTDVFKSVKEKLHEKDVKTLEDTIIKEVVKSINKMTEEFMQNATRQNDQMVKDFKDTVTQKMKDLSDYVEGQNNEMKNKVKKDELKHEDMMKTMSDRMECFKDCMENVEFDRNEMKLSLENNKSELLKIAEDASILSTEEITIVIDNFKTDTLQQTEDKLEQIQREAMDTMSRVINATVRAGKSQQYFDSQPREQLHNLDDKGLKDVRSTLEEYYQRLQRMRNVTSSPITAHEVEVCMQYSYCCTKLADKKDDVSTYVEDVKERLTELPQTEPNKEQCNTISTLFQRINVVLVTSKKPKERAAIELWNVWIDSCYKIDYLPKWQSQNILYASAGFYDIYKQIKGKEKKEIRQMCLDGLDNANERLKLLHEAHPDIGDDETAFKYLDSLRRSAERYAEAKNKEKAKELLDEMRRVVEGSQNMPEGAKRNWKRQIDDKIKKFKL